MALPCPPRRGKPWYAIQFRRGAAKMAATVSANSSAVLWVYVHFDGWIIAWQGPRRRERLSQGVIDNSAPLVSHDISYETRLGDVTIAVHTAGFIGCHRDPPRTPVAATMTRQSSRRSRIAPHLPRVILTRGIASIRANITYVHFPSHVRAVCANAPAEVRCPLRLTSLADSGCHLFTMTSLTTMTQMVPQLPRVPWWLPVPIPALLVPTYVTVLSPVLSYLSRLLAHYICLEISKNSVKFYLYFISFIIF